MELLPFHSWCTWVVTSENIENLYNAYVDFCDENGYEYDSQEEVFDFYGQST